LGKGELREAAMQADHELRKNPHDGFVQTFESGEVDSNFAAERSLLFGMTFFTGHGFLLKSRLAVGEP
jgi:hypothetical protein